MFMRNKILSPPHIFARVAVARLFVSLVCLLWMVSGSVAFGAETYYFSYPSSSNNTVTVDGGTVTLNNSIASPGSYTGGHKHKGQGGSTTSYEGDHNIQSADYIVYNISDDMDEDSSNNIITVNGDSASTYVIDGGRNHYTSSTFTNLIGDANQNKVFFNSGNGYEIIGGFSAAGNAEYNEVQINNGAGTIISELAGGESRRANANHNVVTINGGQFGTGFGMCNTYGGSTIGSGGNANYNEITINGGQFHGGNIYGGHGENVEGNHVNIYGGSMSNYVDIYAGSGKVVKDNEINVYNSPDLSGAVLHGYYAYGVDTHSGNALNIYTKDITAQNIAFFDLINFHLPDGIKNNDTVLTLTGGSATDISGAAVTAYVPGNNALNDGDTVNLLVNNSGITDTNTTYNGTLEEGVSFSHKIEVKKTNDNTVALVVGEPTTTPVVTPTSGGETTPTTPTAPTEKRLNAQTSILPAPMLAAPAIMSRHIDSTINWLPPQDNFWSEDKGKGNANDLTTTDPVNKPGWSIFANMSGSVMHTKTGNGSNMDTRSGGLDIGAARAFVGDNSTTYVAPLVDYGGGSYDSYLGDGTHGNGKTKFFMGGFIARHAFNNGFYYEGSFRYGRATMDFFSNDPKMMFNGQPEKYDTSAPCWAGHINVGKRLKIDPYNALDVYAIYFHTHQNGMEADLASGETYRFDAVTNYRLRTGARLTRYTSDHSRFYSGIAYEYTHDGAARGTYLARGLSTEEIGGSGSSVMLELGYQLKPNKNNPWMLDVAAVGWAGHQRGFSIQAKMKKEF